MTGSANRSFEVSALTGLRGFAALWVFLYHFWALQVKTPVVIGLFSYQLDISSCFTFGWLGVTIFFVLSGFLLAQPFIQQFSVPSTKKLNLGSYFVRRILRVFPGYYVQLLILSLLAYFFQFGTYPQDSASWLAHLSMTIFSPPFFIDGINGVWWTLPIEFSFYILLPILAILLKRRRGLILFIDYLLRDILINRTFPTLFPQGIS
jgi:peptidoglycan/LPS O-acetylase OafA/YrhL